MNTLRGIARQTAFQFIYRLDNEKNPLPKPNELATEVLAHFTHFSVNEDAREFALRLVLNTLQNLPKVDETLAAHLQNWRMERIGSVEKALLRMGTAELLYFKDIPTSVTLDEIVELGKTFGTDESASFLNGILDPISKLPEATTGKVASNP